MMTDEAKVDRRKSPEFREAARARALAQWTPEARAAQSALTRERMRSPAVRQRIKQEVVDRRERQLVMLRAAWKQADKQTRSDFLVEIATIIAEATP